MRAIHYLSLALGAPLTSLAAPYQVEMILIRQNAAPALYSAPAAERWQAEATPLDRQAQQPNRLDATVERLQANADYTVLLHKSWQQELDGIPAKVAISDGEAVYGRSPIEGTLSLTEGRFISAQARFYVNDLDRNGGVLRSEQFRQSNANIKRGQLNFLDGGHLGLLLKVTPVGMRQQATPDPELLEQ